MKRQNTSDRNEVLKPTPPQTYTGQSLRGSVDGGIPIRDLARQSTHHVTVASMKEQQQLEAFALDLWVCTVGPQRNDCCTAHCIPWCRYFIYTAAVVARYDPAWAKKYNEKVLMLVRDIANPRSAAVGACLVEPHGDVLLLLSGRSLRNQIFFP